jgi:RNA polymerase sigma-70 factor (ECF subfamily)
MWHAERREPFFSSFCMPRSPFHLVWPSSSGQNAGKPEFTPLMVDEAPGSRTADPRSDAELVAGCQAGDREAFHELTQRYYRPVCGFLFKRVGEPDLVEDLAQETFLEVYQALKTGGRPTHFSSWLFGIAHHRCGKWFRRKRPALFPANEPPDRPAPTPSDTREELEEQERLLARLETGLAGLSEEMRTMLRLKHRHGKTCEEIARELGRPVGTIKSQLARTYKALREQLGGGERP